MTPSIQTLLLHLKNKHLKFSEVIATIDTFYEYKSTAFKNGEIFNQADQNQGSAKVFYFAQLHQLSEKETLILFAEHYQAVLNTPEGSDHQNIRQFMKHGWEGIQFESEALKAK